MEKVVNKKCILESGDAFFDGVYPIIIAVP